jgi:hypothetical protein
MGSRPRFYLQLQVNQNSREFLIVSWCGMFMLVHYLLFIVLGNNIKWSSLVLDLVAKESY